MYLQTQQFGGHCSMLSCPLCVTVLCFVIKAVCQLSGMHCMVAGCSFCLLDMTEQQPAGVLLKPGLPVKHTAYVPLFVLGLLLQTMHTVPLHSSVTTKDRLQSGHTPTATQVGLAVALRFKRDGHAVLLEWRRIAHWQRRCKAVLQQAAGRLKNRSLSMAVQEWQYQTWKAAALRRAAHFVQNHALVAAFNSWKAHHELCLLERAVAKFTQLSTSKWVVLMLPLCSISSRLCLAVQELPCNFTLDQSISN